MAWEQKSKRPRFSLLEDPADSSSGQGQQQVVRFLKGIERATKSSEMRQCQGLGAMKPRELSRLLGVAWRSHLPEKDRTWFIRQVNELGQQFLKTYEEAGQTVPYELWEGILSDLRHWVISETLISAALHPDDHTESDWRKDEGIKLQIAELTYRHEPAHWALLKPFVLPVSKEVFQKAEMQYYLTQAYKVLGHKILSDAGMSFLQKLWWILSYKLRRVLSFVW